MATLDLVSMPWASSARPHLSTALLLSIVQEAGFSARAVYPSLTLAAELSGEAYEGLAETPSLFGPCEHVFAVDVFGAEALKSDEYLSRFDVVANQPFRYLRDVVVPRFLDKFVGSLMADRPAIVGFSCTFNQVMPSLAAARRIKLIDPRVMVIFGGACVHGEMGESYARAFPEWIDHVFTGEADESLVAFLEKWRCGAELGGIPGVTCAGRLAKRAEPVASLEGLPRPRYEDWFAQRAELGDGADLPGVEAIPFESSRGCWWGAKSHCTFCGLNNEGMQYRAKSSERTIGEIVGLAERYKMVSLMAADNILQADGYRRLVPKLKELGLDLQLFYEIKANVRRDDVRGLAESGIGWVQPGIESFSTAVLKLMHKGVTALQNVQMLKWAAENGVRPSYNILVGFDGESDVNYAEMVEVMRRIRHLPPPMSRSTDVQVHRFSPFFRAPLEFGIRGLRPSDYYHYLIPAERADAWEFAYFFECDLPEDAPLRRWRGVVDEVIGSWRRGNERMSAFLGPGLIEVRREAEGGVRREVLTGVDCAVFLHADQQTSLSALERAVAGHGFGPEECAGAIGRLAEHGFLLREGDKVLSIVPYQRPHSEEELAGWLKRWMRSGRSAGEERQMAMGSNGSGATGGRVFEILS